MMKWAVLLIALSSSVAHAATRTLTLAQAVELAMKVDPLVAEAHIAEDRSKLAVLRAQLDRISLRVDGQLQELWNKTNIGGPGIFNCTLGGFTFQSDPSTCTSMGGTSTKAKNQEPESGQGLFNLSAQLNVPLFSGLRVESNVSMRQRLRDAAIVQLHQQRKDTALAVARAYWAVRRLSLMRDVQASTIARLRESEEVTAGRVNAGLAPPIDKNRATERLLQQQAQLADLNGQLNEAAVQLAVTLGVSDDLVLVDQPDVPDATPPPVDSLLDDAHHGRPELAVARLNAEAQHFNVRIARSNFFPQIGLFGLFQYGNNPFQVTTGARSATDVLNPFANMSGNLTLGATLSMNFFDTFNTYTGMKDALYEEDRLQAERKRVVRVVDSDVRTAHARVLHLYGQRTPLVAARDVARDNLSILEGRYKNGDALIIEVLDAQNDLTNLELQVADVSAQLYLAWLELQASLGKVVGANP